MFGKWFTKTVEESTTRAIHKVLDEKLPAMVEDALRDNFKRKALSAHDRHHPFPTQR